MTTPRDHFAWRTSSHSNTGNECVEVAAAHGLIAIRDSKDPNGPILTLTTTAWTQLRAAAQN